MASVLHMQFTTVQTTARGEGCAYQTNASVWATGVDRIAAWNSVLMDAQAMDSAKGIDACVRKGMFSFLVINTP